MAWRVVPATSLALALSVLGACSGANPVPPPAGTLAIVTRGAAGSAGAGGSGGAVTVTGGGGGPAQILQTGSFDPGFAADTTAPTLGSNPKAVAANTTLIVGDPANPVNGDTDNTKLATGLWVKAGATLTLQPFAGATSVLNVTDGVLVEGTLAASLNGTDSRNVTIGCANFVVTATGAVTLSGADQAAAAGGSGGNLRVSASGSVVFAGKFAAKGGAGTVGGTGGTFQVSSTGSTLALSGPSIDVSGGSGAGGPGGDAGFIRTDLPSTNFGDVGSSAALTARGGDGTAGGGAGGSVTLRSAQGTVRSSSAVNVSGGDATTAGPGNDAGAIAFQTASRDMLVAGTLTAKGGAGAGGGNPGGAGGDVSLTRGAGAVPGSILLGAGIDTSGGAGSDGGPGGTVTVNGNSGSAFPAASKQRTSLLGYASIDTSGGGGTTNGGQGGSVTLQQSAAFSQPGGGTLYSDNVRNEAPITAKGGAGAAGSGGNGGAVSITGSGTLALPLTRSTVNVADIDASGGSGTTRGGDGPTVTIGDMYLMSNAGKVNVTGGAGGTIRGGNGGAFGFQAVNGPAENLGEVKAGGGSATSGNGGRGGNFTGSGTKVTAIENYTGDGGASTTGPGGSGAFMVLTSTSTSTLFAGTASVKAGAGAAGALPVGVEGKVQIDGVAKPLVSSQYTQ